jgi:hypothetical protein
MMINRDHYLIDLMNKSFEWDIITSGFTHGVVNLKVTDVDKKDC